MVVSSYKQVHLEVCGKYACLRNQTYCKPRHAFPWKYGGTRQSEDVLLVNDAQIDQVDVADFAAYRAHFGINDYMSRVLQGCVQMRASALLGRIAIGITRLSRACV